MKTARERAHEAAAFDCPAAGGHYWECERVTAAILAALTEMREACAREATATACEVVCGHTSCGGMRAAAARIRAMEVK